MNPLMIAGGIAALFMVLTGVQTVRLGNAQESIGKYKQAVNDQIAETEEAVSVNVSLNTNIDQLAGRISDMIESRRMEREEQDRVLAARDEDLIEAVAAARRLEGERDEIFRNDLGCNEMGSLRIDAICPAIAVQLRERTTEGADRNGDEDGGSPSGSDPASASAVDATPVLSSAIR